MKQNDVDVEEVKNGIDKKTGTSVEICFDQNGNVVICDYGGNILEQYLTEEEAKERYLIF